MIGRITPYTLRVGSRMRLIGSNRYFESAADDKVFLPAACLLHISGQHLDKSSEFRVLLAELDLF